VCVIDDASTDPGQRGIIREFSERCGWKVIYNDENKGALFNIIKGVEALECSDDDIIVQMDGDDWLFDRRVLSLLNLYYLKEDIYLTYGQYYSISHRIRGICAPIAREDIDKKRYRQMPWQFSALRTFKYFLWRQIREEDLRDQDENFFQVTWDLAFMCPMLEMAGHHIRFIPEILYTYNDLNPICDSKVRRKEQMRCHQDIRSRRPYERLLEGDHKILALPLTARLEMAWIRTILRLKSCRIHNRRWKNLHMKWMRVSKLNTQKL